MRHSRTHEAGFHCPATLCKHACRIVAAGALGAGVMACIMQPTASSLLSLTAIVTLAWFYNRTVNRRLQRFEEASALIEEHHLMVEIIENSPMPFAVYNEQDRLIAWNKAYEALYESAFVALRGKANERQLYYADLIRSLADDAVPEEQREVYVNQRVAGQRKAPVSTADRYYAKLGWLRVTKFLTPRGAVAGFAVDISELKQREDLLRAEVERSRELEQRLRQLASTDPLTQIPNRRAFLERLDAEFQRMQRYGSGYCVAMMDIDEFKAINDAFGHDVGDTVIASVAETGAQAIRDRVDAIGRLGGDEFAIVLPHVDLEGARQSVERIRESIEQRRFAADDREFSVSVSIGVAEADAGDTAPAMQLKRADEALYRAKRSGRNKVVGAPD